MCIRDRPTGAPAAEATVDAPPPPRFGGVVLPGLLLTTRASERASADGCAATIDVFNLASGARVQSVRLREALPGERELLVVAEPHAPHAFVALVRSGRLLALTRGPLPSTSAEDDGSEPSWAAPRPAGRRFSSVREAACAFLAGELEESDFHPDYEATDAHRAERGGSSSSAAAFEPQDLADSAHAFGLQQAQFAAALRRLVAGVPLSLIHI